MNKEIGHYPFTQEQDSLIINRIKGNLYFFINDLFPVKGFRKTIYYSLVKHFNYVESLFSEEENLREKGDSRANLFYHNKHHALYQATFDAISVSGAIKARRDQMSKYLSTEGVLSIVLAAMYHDAGYVTAEQSPKNYAALTPVHVEKSKETLVLGIDKIGLPEFLDKEKIKKLAVLGIHNTYFPYTDERKNEFQKLLRGMNSWERKEAMIVGLSVQLADLGGQVARKDYFPERVKDLRQELDSASQGLGTKIIGIDQELAQKCSDFVKTMVFPTAGKTSGAFFGRENSFQEAWSSLIE